MTNKFYSLKLVVNGGFSCNDMNQKLHCSRYFFYQ